jgi:predicted TIM-barrel fold metal-dependent hydrolase
MALRGGWDPRARLVDMDADGIDAAVLYPTTMLAVVPDPGLFAALCRAYNNWLADYCSADRARLVGVGVVPLQDVALALREAQRCVRELGFRAVMIRPAPYIGTRKLYHPVYDPFWQEVQDLGVPVAVASEGLFLRQGLSNALDVMVALAWFTGGGICERFPRLKVAFLEGSGGWVCTLLERLDHHFHIFGSAHQKTPPGELFARQCWISFDPDEVALPFTAATLGAERIVHRVGVGLPAPRRQDPRRGRRAARGRGRAGARRPGADPGRDGRRPLRAVRRACRARSSSSARAGWPRWCCAERAR